MDNTLRISRLGTLCDGLTSMPEAEMHSGTRPIGISSTTHCVFNRVKCFSPFYFVDLQDLD